MCGTLAACDKLKQMDAATSELASAKAEIADGRQQLADLRTNLDGLITRVMLLELAGQIEEADKKAAAAVNKDAPQVLTPSQVQLLNGAIGTCVDSVRKSEPATAGDRKFDAYYNPAKGKVQNNALFVSQQPSLYAFNKCMSDQGFPLM